MGRGRGGRSGGSDRAGEVERGGRRVGRLVHTRRAAAVRISGSVRVQGRVEGVEWGQEVG